MKIMISSMIFNYFFASKSQVNGSDEDPPYLEKKDSLPYLSTLNTSPIEVDKLIRTLKKSKISQLLYLVNQIRTSWGKSKVCHGLF